LGEDPARDALLGPGRHPQGDEEGDARGGEGDRGGRGGTRCGGVRAGGRGWRGGLAAARFAGVVGRASASAAPGVDFTAGERLAMKGGSKRGCRCVDLDRIERTKSTKRSRYLRSDHPLLLPFAPSYSRFSSPNTGERSRSPTLRIASSTPGMKDSRAIESWRIDSVWPSPPKSTSW